MDQSMEDPHTASLEAYITASQPAVKAGEMLERLQKNKDFQTLIVDGYFRQEAIRLVHAVSEPTREMQAPEVQADLQNNIRAIGCFSNYLHEIMVLAQRAKESIEQTEESLEDIRNNVDPDEFDEDDI